MQYRIRAHAISHIGLRREKQEDNFLLYDGKLITHKEREGFRNKVYHQISKEYEGISDRALFSVSDGMGGHSAGEIASMFITNALKNQTKTILHSFNLEKGISNYQRFVSETNEQLCIYASEEPAFLGMGATLATLILLDDQIVGLNVGDSRIYHYRFNQLKRLSKDHTQGQRLLDLNLLTLDELKSFQDQKALTRYFGITKPHPLLRSEVTEKIKPEEKEWFLLCTDGLTDSIFEDDLKLVLDENYVDGNLTRAATKLVDMAIEGTGERNGGTDNITLVLMEIMSQ